MVWSKNDAAKCAELTDLHHGGGPRDRHLMMRLGQAAAAGQLAILCANKRKQVQEG